MKSHRKIIPIVGLAIAFAGFTPPSAPASPLLSGYGGPGQGTQAILGSTLLNGPSGGGGSPGGGSPATGITSSTVGGGSSAGAHSRAASGTRSGAGGSGATIGAGASRSPSALAATRASAAGSGVLGLSDSAFLAALLAFAALLFTGLLTRGLARASWTRWHAGS
ncbi:MAG TPA: hypothetical protein VNZ01_07000 [Solirubrobacteraceae bacterium]|jgi:hypothetical protein|nr:hypothetical protein [Solirubrobacteraceae bacterium]